MLIDLSDGLFDVEPDWGFPVWTDGLLDGTERTLALRCGRRSAKSSWLVGRIAQHGLPGEVHPYVTHTIGRGEEIVLPIVERLAATHGFAYERNGQRGTITFESGAVLQFFGLSSKPELAKLVGTRCPWFTFDECQDMKQGLLLAAIYKTQPNTVDLRRRVRGPTTVLAGTGGVPSGDWYELLGGNDGPPLIDLRLVRATMRDNHHIADASATIAEIMASNRWTPETPEYRWEYEAEFAPFTAGRCYEWDGILWPAPATGSTFVGIDFGESSPCAWAVCRAEDETVRVGNMMVTRTRVTVIEAIEQVCGSLEEIAAITRTLAARHGAGWIVGDSAEGFGIRQLRSQYGIPVSPSKKRGSKAERIMHARGMLRMGTLGLSSGCEILEKRLREVVWNEDHTDHLGADHVLDALHYALEELFSTVQEDRAAPVPGTPEALAAQQEALRARVYALAARGGRR